MTLDTKYDTFYSADAARAAHADMILQGWPRHPMEAILYLSFSGDTMPDVGCGDGLNLYHFRGRFRRLIGLEYLANRLEAARASARATCRLLRRST